MPARFRYLVAAIGLGPYKRASSASVRLTAALRLTSYRFVIGMFRLAWIPAQSVELTREFLDNTGRWRHFHSDRNEASFLPVCKASAVL